MLARIDDRAIAAALAQAEAEEPASRRSSRWRELDLSRYRNLEDQHVISRQTIEQQGALVEQLKAGIQASEATIAAQRVQLSYATITSPVRGRVGIRKIDQGNLVQAGDTNGLVTVTQIDPISIVFTLPQEVLSRLRDCFRPAGRSARHRVRSRLERAARRGQAQHVRQSDRHGHRHASPARRVRQSRRQALARPVRDAAAGNRQQRERGRHSCARDSAGTERCVRLSRAATRKAEVVPIVTTYLDDDIAVIASGVVAGDTIVVDGQSRLKPGAKVKHDGGQRCRREERGSRRRQECRRHLSRQDPAAGGTRPPLAEWFIRHPIGTVLLTVGLVLLGAIAYPMLPLAPLPEVELPTIQISGSLPGASPETMASAVATPLEVQLSGVPGTREMTSSSSLGSTSITMQFELSKNIDVAAQEVQAAINAAAGRLPSDMPSLPTWKKAIPTTARFSRWGCSPELMTLEELSDLAETSVARKLSQINGVSEVNVYGQRKPALRVQASPERLAALGITFADIRQVLQAASVNQAKGAIYGRDRVSTLATNDQIFAPKDYGALIVAYHDGAPVFLRDVAKVSIGAENEYVGSWQNGKPGMYIMVRRQPGANIVSTAEAVRSALPDIRRQLPASVTLEVLNDRTPNDPLVAARSGSDAGGDLPARDPGHGRVPAAALGHGHRRVRAGGCARRDRSPRCMCSGSASTISRSSRWSWRWDSSWTTPSSSSRTSTGIWKPARRCARRRCKAHRKSAAPSCRSACRWWRLSFRCC